jgi:hypothetical protein
MCNCNNKRLKFITSYAESNVKANPNMAIVSLWKRVLSDDALAKQEFAKMYIAKFPNNRVITNNLTNENLHTMYKHLTH